MIDLRGYNEVSESGGSYQQLPAGGYVCRIVNVELGERNNRPQIRVAIDIAEGEYAGHFAKQNRDKWSNSAIFTRYIYDENEKFITPALKSLLANVERSNDNFTADLQNNLRRFDQNTLVGKLCGFTFGEREYEYNERIYTTTEVKFPKAVSKIRSGDFEVPPLQRLEAAYPPPSKNDIDFSDVPF